MPLRAKSLRLFMNTKTQDPSLAPEFGKCEGKLKRIQQIIMIENWLRDLSPYVATTYQAFTKTIAEASELGEGWSGAKETLLFDDATTDQKYSIVDNEIWAVVLKAVHIFHSERLGYVMDGAADEHTYEEIWESRESLKLYHQWATYFFPLMIKCMRPEDKKEYLAECEGLTLSPWKQVVSIFLHYVLKYHVRNSDDAWALKGALENPYDWIMTPELVQRKSLVRATFPLIGVFRQIRCTYIWGHDERRRRMSCNDR